MSFIRSLSLNHQQSNGANKPKSFAQTIDDQKELQKDIDWAQSRIQGDAKLKAAAKEAVIKSQSARRRYAAAYWALDDREWQLMQFYDKAAKENILKRLEPREGESAKEFARDRAKIRNMRRGTIFVEFEMGLSLRQFASKEEIAELGRLQSEKTAAKKEIETIIENAFLQAGYKYERPWGDDHKLKDKNLTEDDEDKARSHCDLLGSNNAWFPVLCLEMGLISIYPERPKQKAKK